MNQEDAWLVLTLGLVAGAVACFINWMQVDPSQADVIHRRLLLIMGLVLLGMAAIISGLTLLR